MKNIIVLFLFTVLLSPFVQAQKSQRIYPSAARYGSLNAGDLRDACANAEEEFTTGTTLDAHTWKRKVNNALCVGFVNGWLQGVNGLAAYDGKKMSRMVVDEVSPRLMISIFLKYMAKHPENKIKSAATTLRLSVADADMLGNKEIPCPVPD